MCMYVCMYLKSSIEDSGVWLGLGAEGPWWRRRRELLEGKDKMRSKEDPITEMQLSDPGDQYQISSSGIEENTFLMRY